MAGAEPALRVLLVGSPAQRQLLTRPLVLPPGSTVAQALDAAAALEAVTQDAGWAALLAGVGAGVQVSVWGRKVPPAQALHDGDRIELSRPLQVDPKEARRQRYQAQGGRRLPRGYTPPSRPRTAPTPED